MTEEEHEVWETIHASDSGGGARMEEQVLVIQEIEKADTEDTRVWEC